MKILFDHQKFSTQKYGGISRYFANIIQEIKKRADWEYELGVLVSNNHYLNDLKLPLNPLAPSLLKKPEVAYKINRFYSKQLLTKDNYDLFHPTYYDPYFVKSTRKPVVVTIHDMTYERLPEYFWAQDPLTFQKRLNIERADKIIAISETTKKDLLKYSEADESKIEVIYHGIDFNTPLMTSPLKNIPKNYILFVGDRSGYKNFYLFINAYKQLSNRYNDVNVILTGGGSMGIADVELLKRMKLENKVQHVNASDEELNFLYQNALVFVYPSLYEGFGLPILEAFRACCPVILSDTDCFKEIGADAAAFFKMHEMEDLLCVMEKIITDSALRQQLVEKGQDRLKDFPLSKSVNQTLSLYSSVL